MVVDSMTGGNSGRGSCFGSSGTGVTSVAGVVEAGASVGAGAACAAAVVACVVSVGASCCVAAGVVGASLGACASGLVWNGSSSHSFPCVISLPKWPAAISAMNSMTSINRNAPRFCIAAKHAVTSPRVPAPTPSQRCSSTVSPGYPLLPRIQPLPAANAPPTAAIQASVASVARAGVRRIIAPPNSSATTPNHKPIGMCSRSGCSRPSSCTIVSWSISGGFPSRPCRRRR